MAYHPLTDDTAQTPERRREEADSLCRMLEGHVDSMTDKERDFMESITDSQWCSAKQLFWLRDLRDRYC